MKTKKFSMKAACACIAVSALITTGCGASAPAPAGNASSASEAGGTTAAESGEHTVLKVEIWDRGLQDYAAVDNNMLTEWINKQFGEPNNVTVEFIPCPRNQEIEKLNMWMASDDAPDIMFTYNTDTVVKYAEAGGLMQLDDLLAEYGQDFVALTGSETQEYGKIGGKQYAAMAVRALNAGMGATLMRQDWLDAVGMEAPSNTKELYEVLKAFRDKDPGGFGAETIPWAVSLNPEMQRGYFTMGYSFYDWDNIDDKMWNTAPDIALPGYKDSLRFMNKLYNEHLITLDFALDADAKQAESDFAAGKAGMYVANLGAADLLGQDKPGYVCKQNCPEAEFVTIDPFTGNSDTYPKYNRTASPLCDKAIIIPASSKNGELAVKYLNWMSQPEVLKYLQFGEEGLDYTEDEGYPVPTDDPTREKYHRNDYAFIMNGTQYSDIKKYPEAVLSSYEEEFHKPVEDALNLCQERFRVWPYLPVANAENDKYGAALATIKDELIVQSIMAAPDKFDEIFDKYYNDYMSSGGQAVWDEAAKLYDSLQQ